MLLDSSTIHSYMLKIYDMKLHNSIFVIVDYEKISTQFVVRLNLEKLLTDYL